MSDHDLGSRLRAIRRFCFLFALVAIILYGLAFFYFWFFGKILDPLTSLFQFLLIVAWSGIMLPYFMRMEAKTDYGLEQNKQIADVLSPLGPLIEKASDQIDKYSNSESAKELASVLHAIEEHMAVIRNGLAERTGKVARRGKVATGQDPIRPGQEDGISQVTVSVQDPSQDLPKSE